MNRTKMIVTAGLFVSIYAAFFIIDMQASGILVSSFFCLLPLPLSIFSFIYGFKYSLIPYISVILIGFLINPISTLLYIIEGGLIGCIYGQLTRNKTKQKYKILLCILLTFISDLLSMVILASLVNYSINEEIYLLLKYLLKMLKINIENELIISRLISLLIPLFIGVFSIIEGLLIHFINGLIMNRLKLIKFNIGSLYLFSLPKWISIIYLILLLAHLLTFKYFYNSSNYLYYISYIISLLFWISSLIIFANTYLILNLIFSKTKFQILYLIIFLILLFIFPIPFIFIISLLGNVFIISEYQTYLLYNNKCY